MRIEFCQTSKTFVYVTRGPTGITGMAGTLGGPMSLLCGEDRRIVGQSALPQDHLLQLLALYGQSSKGAGTDFADRRVKQKNCPFRTPNSESGEI